MTRTRFILTAFAVTIALISASTAHGQQKAPDGAILISQTTVLGGLAGDGFGFPITLTQPGLYRLIGNIVVPDANTTALVIAADNVTLDLNGFAIIGPNRCLPDFGPATDCSALGDGDGIRTDGNHQNITVRNGTITGMGTSGMFLQGRGVRIEGIHASHNGARGIQLEGGGGLILHSTAYNNLASGIAVISGVITLGNVARYNGSRGIQFGSPRVGAGQNIVADNGSDTLNANQTDGNVCGDALCPP
jgi:hypothetical protein